MNSRFRHYHPSSCTHHSPPRIKRWHVLRRYREFALLHKHLKNFAKETPDMAAADFTLPNLPPKEAKLSFGSSIDPAFVAERRTQLQEYVRSPLRPNTLVSFPHHPHAPSPRYLRELTKLKFVWHVDSGLARFLDDKDGTLSVLCELERLRLWEQVCTCGKTKVPVDSRRTYPAPFPFATYLQAIRDDEKPLVTQRELRKLSGDISLLETSLVS